MERIPVGKGRFLIELSREEIENVKEWTKMALELGMGLAAIVAKNEEQKVPIVTTDRQINGIVHAVINENLPIEEAEARIKLIAELNTFHYSTEDK